jgi:hypothetical protein
LTITTTAASAKMTEPARPFGLGLRSASGILCAGLLGLLLPRRRRVWPVLLAMLLALATVSNLGCGQTALRDTPGAGVTGGTPQGTAVLTINSSGTDGVTTISHTYSYALNIQ